MVSRNTSLPLLLPGSIVANLIRGYSPVTGDHTWLCESYRRTWYGFGFALIDFNLNPTAQCLFYCENESTMDVHTLLQSVVIL